MDIFEDTLNEINAINLKCIESLKEYCKDKNLKELISIILSNENTDEKHYLEIFIYKCGYNVYRSKYHGTDVLYELNHFISNYFYDDAEAYFIKHRNQWDIDNSKDDGIPATAKDFVDKARENCRD